MGQLRSCINIMAKAKPSASVICRSGTEDAIYVPNKEGTSIRTRMMGSTCKKQRVCIALGERKREKDRRKWLIQRRYDGQRIKTSVFSAHEMR